MTTTLSGEVKRVTYENEGTSFRVVKLTGVPERGEVSIVGTFQAVGPGTQVRVTGKFVQDSKHGEQFRVETLVLVDPSTLVGIERYLGSGIITGIGPGFAKRVVERFGLETLKVLDEDPGRLAEVRGLGKKRAEALRESWRGQRALGSVMLLLETHGASPSLAPRIIERFGDRAAAIVSGAPYRLALDVRGVGFKTADKIAHSLGIAGDHPERAQAGVVHTLERHADRGHVVSSRRELVTAATEMLEIDERHVDVAIDALWAQGRLVVEGEDVFLSHLHAAERGTAELLARLLESPGTELGGVEAAIARFEHDAGIQVAAAQRGAVEAAAREKVVVITGGPGVGKTTTVRAILSLFAAAKLTVRLAAPTGRAAKRLTETTGQAATTIHRLLEYEPHGRGFQRDVESPIAADAVIIDEMSMVDIALANSLLAAIPTAARLIIVGDADQLQSVGPGAVLRDVLRSRAVTAVQLNEIFRQSSHSTIVENAHAIRRGDAPQSDAAGDASEFFVIERRDPERAADTVLELVENRIPKRFGLDPRRDVQVLCPMHRGPAGTEALNARLQAALNPAGSALSRRGQTLRVGDKVMQLRNDYEREVFNGDIGSIVAVTGDAALRVAFDGRSVDYTGAELDELTLAYATSIHKAQGSEYPAVVLPILTSHFVMLSRNLVYTAVTRAKRLCILVADPRAIRLALAEMRQDDRATRLAERIEQATRSRSVVS